MIAKKTNKLNVEAEGGGGEENINKDISRKQWVWNRHTLPDVVGEVHMKLYFKTSPFFIQYIGKIPYN